MALLTDADLCARSAALRRHKTITLTRAFGDVHLTATTRRADPVWGVRMVVQVRVVQGRAEWVQSFGTTAEAREALE